MWNGGATCTNGAARGNRKFRKMEKNPVPKNGPEPLPAMGVIARGPPAGPLCKVLETGSKEIFRNLRSKKNFGEGLTRKWGAETLRKYGEFVAPVEV